MPASPRVQPPDEGPVVVLAPPAPRRPGVSDGSTQGRRASEAAQPRRNTPARVITSAPSADGVVASRPPAVSGSHARSGVIQSPPAGRVAQPASQHGGAAAPPDAGAASGVTASPTPRAKAPASLAREAPADSIFGEDLISEKSLDEVILAYLAEDAKHPK
jgi:hypothetical protein